MMWFAELFEDNKATNATLNFFNGSSSYDATRRAVHFWGSSQEEFN
jgi:hypothetical protein